MKVTNKPFLLLQMDFTDECVFNEMLEQHYYNTYSSAKHSGARRTMYLALDARGRPRKVQLPAKRSLGKLSGYVRVLTRPAQRTISNTCIKNATISTSTHHPPRHACRNNKKKKRKCKEGEKPVADGCELYPNGKPGKKHSQQAQPKCAPGSADCIKEQIVIKNINAGMPGHARHKRPLKIKKFHTTKPVEPSEPILKKKRVKQLKKKRKVGRALEDPHVDTTQPATTSWESDEDSWTITPEDAASSTQVEDVTLWEMTTTSGFSREFFRTASAVQETAEEEDS